MGGMCKTIMSLLILLAGIVMMGNVQLAGFPAFQMAGILFTLLGLIKLVHCMGMCSMCSSCCMPEKEMGKKAKK